MEELIKDYIQNKLNEEDISRYAKRKNVVLKDDEAKIIYLYIKNYWQVFYKGDPKELWLELKEKLSKDTYNELFKLYKTYKSKIYY